VLNKRQNKVSINWKSSKSFYSQFKVKLFENWQNLIFLKLFKTTECKKAFAIPENKKSEWVKLYKICMKMNSMLENVHFTIRNVI